MLNKIKWRGVLLKEVVKKGKFNYYMLENGENIKAGDFRKQDIEIQCSGNSKWYKRGLQTRWLENKLFYSREWLSAGEQNAFYGKQHSEKVKQAHSKFMKGRYVGNKNPMYNKSVVDAWKEKYPNNWQEKYDKWIKNVSRGQSGENNGFYGKTHSDKVKKILSEKAKIWANTPEGRKICKKGGIAASSKKGRKTKIEKIIEEKLKEFGVDFKYCFILDGKYQYDFLIGDKTILEVQGDYWHANPKIYGEGLKPLNERQIFKVERDKEKKKYAEEKGYGIYYIWEDEINKGEFDMIGRIKC